MNEAENKTNSDFESVNSVNSTTAEQVLSFCNLTNQTLASVVVPVSQAEQEVINCVTVGSEFKANEISLAAIAPSQKLEVVSLIQILRSSNSNLTARVTQLEQSLSECQEALQSSQQRSQINLMLTQKTQELAAVQEQVKCLSEEIKSSCQITQRQQSLIETLTTELQNSQERFAQLEWEHYLTQANYTEKSEQLIQTENTCRELRTRLTRQQHYTLQLKVALEKCLDPISSTQSESNSDRIPTNAKNEFQSFFGRESIPPWSAEPEFLTQEIDTDWVEHSIGADFQTQSYDHSALSNWSDEDLSGSIEVESISEVETNQPILSQADAFIDFIQQPIDVKSDRSSSQPDELIENCPNSLETQSSNQNITKSEKAKWPSLHNPLENATEPELSTVITYTANSASDQLDEQLNESNPASDSLSSHTAQVQSSDPQEQKTSSFTSDSSWPSPLISPSHTPKRKKSLAAIELPNFTKLGTKS